MEHATVTISMQLAAALRQYLGTRPFDEVAPMIMALQQAADAKPEAPAKD